jgi:hypothetical protein
MRFTWVTLLAVVLSFGCASKPAQEENQFVDKSNMTKATAQSREPSDKKGGSEKTEITPSNELSGKIVLVNDQLRYVVVDFGFGLLPQPEQRLGVYRAGKKVAEIKISSHSRNSNFAADILTGKVADGDEVKQ